MEKVTQSKSELEAKILAAQEQAKSDDPEKARLGKQSLILFELVRDALNSLAGTRAGESAMRQAFHAAHKYLAAAKAERDTIIRLLQSQLDAAQRQLERQCGLIESQRGFELGEHHANDIIKAEQALAEMEAKVQQLELLLNMYQSLGTDHESPQPESAAASSQQDPLAK